MTGFGSTLGHANATVAPPVYLDLVARGLLWVCGKLDDAFVFRIMGVGQVANSVKVEWESVPGWSYAVEAAPAVTGPRGSVPGGPVTATNVISAATIPTVGVPLRFIRVQLITAPRDEGRTVLRIQVSAPAIQQSRDVRVNRPG